MKKIISLFLAVATLVSIAYADEISSNENAVETVEELMEGYIDLDAEVEEEEKQGIIEIDKELIVQNTYGGTYLDILYMLGIIDSVKDIEKTVTRDEFAHYLYRLGGSETAGYYGGEMGFHDIFESEYRDEINVVASKGYMSGRGNSMFCPSENISTNEAVCAIMRMAGYKLFAESYGGYPNGYLKCASQTNLLRQAELEKELTYENLTRILYNALFVKVIKISEDLSYAEGFSHSVDKATELLLANFETKRIKGQLSATEYASIKNKDIAYEGQVIINSDGTDYNFITDTDMSDILGFEGYFYIFDDEKVLAYELQEGKNESVEINGKGIISVNKTLTEFEAVKDENDSGKKYKISPDADFIYNGKNYYEITKEDIENLNGNVRLVDYDSDETYDIVYVWNYETYFVESIINKNLIVNDKEIGKFIEFDEEENKIRFFKMGKMVDFSSIKENDVILVAKSKDDKEKLITVQISSMVVEGTVEFIDEEKIQIDGIRYNFSKDFKKNGISLGTKALFGLNHMNDICCYEKVYVSKKEYAYLLDCFMGEGENDERIYLKVYSQNDCIEKIKVSEKFYVNNEKTTPDGLKALIGGESGVSMCLIAMVRNADGDIKHIYLSGEATPIAKDSAKDKLTFNKKYTGYRIRKVSIMAEYVTDNDTKMFVIVKDGKGNFMEKASGVYDKTTCPVADAYRPTTLVYDAGEDLCAGAVVYDVSENDYATMIGSVSTFSLLVNRIDEELDENGEIINRAYGYLSGNEVNYVLDDTMDISDWARGDIRMISTLKGSDKIGNSRQFFGIENKTGKNPENILYRDTDYTLFPAFYNLTETTDNTSQESPMYGTLTDISLADPSYICIKLADGSGGRVANIASHSRFYSYSEKSGFSSITKEEIIRGKEAYVMTRYGNVMELVIFE